MIKLYTYKLENSHLTSALLPVYFNQDSLCSVQIIEPEGHGYNAIVSLMNGRYFHCFVDKHTFNELSFVLNDGRENAEEWDHLSLEFSNYED